ncbi:transaldolase family protein [Streptomyces sp. H27-D2]|uniref:transaldolase family protein n=1 Tax=Streptomyces sp. H27-D2 TaxID=3046304 RepID=UPI002DB9EA7B|nr:transaldolase family protein [Streptomyces sp. H27-D2]MEC4019641.1 transaldolase family protein [Streptomyces sp. H27-D2]
MTPAPDPLRQLINEGVSPWLEGVDRSVLVSGRLAWLVRYAGIRGVVCEPGPAAAIAIAEGDARRGRSGRLAGRGVPLERAVRELVVDDVRLACDALRGVHEATRGHDGHVSMALDPGLLHDAPSAAGYARELVRAVDRPNVLVRIPAVGQGLAAIRDCLAQGIGVHACGICSAQQYDAVLRAHMDGLELAGKAGLRLSSIACVASMAVQPIDAEVDRLLVESGTAAARPLLGEAARASARLVYRLLDERLGSSRWRALSRAGGRPQRLMWTTAPVPSASSDASEALGLSAVRYLERLVGWNTVIALTPAALAAVHRCEPRGDTLLGTHRGAQSVLDGLDLLGIPYDTVARRLAAECLDRLSAAWRGLRAAVAESVERAGEPAAVAAESVERAGDPM